VRQWLDALQHAGADFTLSFRRLADVVATGDTTPLQALRDAVPGFNQWLEDWQARLAREPMAPRDRAAAMRRVNPAFIPRNHRVESALLAATAQGDLDPFLRLLGIVMRPYEDQPDSVDFTLPPTDSERVTATFCGT
jgi:serine/tyrosine/threonine adenylyltransferase